MKKVGDTVTYTKGDTKKSSLVIAVDEKNGDTRYELENAAFVYDSDLDGSAELSEMIRLL